MADSTRGSRTKVLLALAGGGAVVAMAGLTVAFDQGAPLVVPAVAAPVLPGPMTQGATATVDGMMSTTTPPPVLATEKAVVTHKAQPYKG